MYEKWKTTDLADFFKLLPSKNITLISKSEAADRYICLELCTVWTLLRSYLTSFAYMLEQWRDRCGSEKFPSQTWVGYPVGSCWLTSYGGNMRPFRLTISSVSKFGVGFPSHYSGWKAVPVAGIIAGFPFCVYAYVCGFKSGMGNFVSAVAQPLQYPADFSDLPGCKGFSWCCG